VEGHGDVLFSFGQIKPHGAPQLAIPKTPNKPYGQGSSPNAARAVALSRSPSIQELLFAEDDEEHSDGVNAHLHQRTRVRSNVGLKSSSKESFTTSPSKEGLKGCACSRTSACRWDAFRADHTPGARLVICLVTAESIGSMLRHDGRARAFLGCPWPPPLVSAARLNKLTRRAARGGLGFEQAAVAGDPELRAVGWCGCCGGGGNRHRRRAGVGGRGGVQRIDQEQRRQRQRSGGLPWSHQEGAVAGDLPHRLSSPSLPQHKCHFARESVTQAVAKEEPGVVSVASAARSSTIIYVHFNPAAPMLRQVTTRGTWRGCRWGSSSFATRR
jgi:hypothetical protein